MTNVNQLNRSISRFSLHHRVFRKLLVFVLIFLQVFTPIVVRSAFAASSPWTQTNWDGGSGQTSWSDTTKYDSATDITTSSTGQTTLTNTEELSNTGFESDLTGWSTATTFYDTNFLGTSGAVAAWPLDETTTTQSYSRAVNPAVATGRNIVLNGTFDTDTVWTKGTGWTIASGVAHSDGTSSNSVLSQTITITAGKAYQVSFTISNYVSGGVRPILGSGGIGTTRSANGTFAETLIGGTGTTFSLGNNSNFVGDIDNVSVTQINIPASTATSATQLLTDGDMETAGTSSWTAQNSATLSKQTGTPHGGSQVLRIARNGVDAPWANQTVLTVGQVYRATGYMRGDGSAAPRLRTSNATLASGTSSTSWQPFDVVWVASTTDVGIGILTGSGTQYVEFDDVVVSSDNYIRPGELMVDVGMENSGTGDWAALNSALLSKETTSPHGGLQVLRITRNGASSPQARPAVTVVGKRYRITGYVRSDGSASPVIVDTSAGTIWTGTSSTSWQYFDIVQTIGTDYRLTSVTSVDGQYTEWDDVSITEVSPLVGKAYDGVNPTRQPTYPTSSGTSGHLTNAYSFDGSNDFVNIYSSDLNSVLNQSEGTLVAWAKVASSSVWTDGTTRYIVRLASDASNQILLSRGSTNNIINATYAAGGTSESINFATSAPTSFFQAAITWDKTSDEVKMYFNGAQQGSTQTGLGTWAANLVSTNTAIGAVGSSGSSSWSGLINDVRLYNRALSDSEILALYTGTVTARDTTTTHNSSVGSAKIVGAADQTSNFTQSVNVGDTNTYNISAYAYTTGAAVTSSDVELLYNSSTVSTTYTSVGGGWYQLTGTVTGVASAVGAGVQVKPGKTVYIDNLSLNRYAATGTLTSSIFDSGQGSNWGTLTYNATTPTNTSVTVKARTSNDSGMSGATAFGSCNAITSGTDISSNNCVTDTHRYIQYQLTLANTTTTVTSTFEDISIAFTISDVTAPSISLTALSPDPNSDTTPTLSGTATDDTGTVTAVQFQMDSTSGSWSSCVANDGSFDEATETFSCTTTTLSDGSHTMYLRATDSNANTTTSGSETSDTFTIDATAPVALALDGPGDNSYTNSERPTFRWKGTTDATSGLSKYVLEIDNPSLGSTQPSGDFSVDNIPTTGTTDVVTNKYVIHFDGFSDSDSNNNYISVYTKSHSDWGDSENDGKLREGRVSWNVKAVDNAGNQTSASRTLFVDRTSPSVSVNQINDTPFSADSYSTTDRTPTIFGRISDPLSGGDSSVTQDENGPRVASGPREVTITVERREGLLYQAHTSYTVNMDAAYYTCDDQLVTDNSKQKCDKYVAFEYQQQESLDLGTYRVTVSGKDKADNSSNQVIFTLNVGTLQAVASPEEEAVIEQEIQTLPQEVQEEVREEIEITRPIEPSALEAAGQSFLTTLTNLLSSIGNAIGTAVRVAFNAISSTLAFVFNAVGQTIAFVFNGVTQAIAWIGNTAGTLLAFIGNSAGNFLAWLGNGYNSLAEALPGFIGTTLKNIGNTTQALALATGNFLGVVGNGISHGLGWVGQGISSIGNSIALGVTNAATGIRTGLTSVAFAIGEKAQDVSGVMGLAIIKFTYNFVPEPTQIFDVRVEVLSPTSARISWKTNHPATGKVNYGLDETYPLDIQTDKRTNDHEFVLTGLLPNTQYHFEVMSQNKNYVYDANRKFTTPAEE